MEQFVWQNPPPPSLIDEESEYVFTCGCNIKHWASKTKRERCTKACYEKKLRKGVEKDCTAQCKGWFPGIFNKDRRACKKICRETEGMEDLTRDDVLDEIAGIYPEDNIVEDPADQFRLDSSQAGMGNMNMIVGIIIGVIILIGAIALIKK